MFIICWGSECVYVHECPFEDKTRGGLLNYFEHLLIFIQQQQNKAV